MQLKIKDLQVISAVETKMYKQYLQLKIKRCTQQHLQLIIKAIQAISAVEDIQMYKAISAVKI